MTTRHYIVATAGHVDHGKSALVKALTGTDPDRLPEEKARKITIDLGFAELNLIAANGDQIHAGIVDVPGHEDFVRNMIAGVGSIDLALFVVAADDGWMPQSEEHLQILSYLNVQRAVVALTKIDLEGINAVTSGIREQLRETPFANARIIPTSILTGAGIEDLKNAIATELVAMQPQRDYGKPRLFVDRVFTLRGIGTVVTGTLTGGKLRRGQSVVIHPQNLSVRIRSIQSHGAELELAQPGMRTAINLPDVSIGQIKRGDVITVADIGLPSSSLVVRLRQSGRLRSRRALKNGTSLYFHHGTSRVAARIIFLEGDSARLKTATPVLVFLGDRFVIRDASEQHTIAGGVVLHPDGEHSQGGTAPDDVEACLRMDLARHHFLQKESALTKSHFRADEIADALQRLESRKEIIVRDGIAADVKYWQNLRNEAIRMIDSAHKRNPERMGLDLKVLRAALPNQPNGTVFDALISDLCSDAFVRKGPVILRTEHRASLPTELQPAETRIRALLAKRAFDPPARKELEPDRQSQQVLRFLIEAGEAVEFGSNVVLLRENFERMKSAVMDFISKNGPASVSELRQALESSRRIMVPLLERLDRDGITRRVGDKRLLTH